MYPDKVEIKTTNGDRYRSREGQGSILMTGKQWRICKRNDEEHHPFFRLGGKGGERPIRSFAGRDGIQAPAGYDPTEGEEGGGNQEQCV